MFNRYKSKNNSNFIVKYLKNKVKEKIYTKNMFKCIVYTDNVKTSKYINILRAYRNLILNFNKKYNGISIQYNGKKENKNSIINFLKKKSNYHLNIYLRHFIDKKFIIDLIKKYKNKISITSDNILKI